MGNNRAWTEIIPPGCRIWLVGLCLAVHPMTHAQYIEVQAEFDTNQIRIGEAFHLNLSVEQPAGMTVTFPPIRDTLVNRIEVLESYPADTLLRNDVLRVEKKIRLTSFDSGLYRVPPLVFGFHSGSWRDSILSHPLYLYVHTVATDSTIYDVKAPIHMPVGFSEVFPYVAGGLLLLVAIAFLVRYLRRRSRGKPVFIPAKPDEPAHITALKELDALKASKLWQRGEFKEYYSKLTEIIRHYMERRYGIPAMEMTSSEILQAWISSGNERQELSGDLNNLLNLADLVKFAREKPLASDNEVNMERAYDFIHRTKMAEHTYGEENEQKQSLNPALKNE